MQVIKPRFRGFIGLATHPEGCAANVRDQVAAARAAGPGTGLGRAVVVGHSTGYGLGSLLAAVWGHGAEALGVCFEREPRGPKTGSAGWYNLAEVHRLAAAEGRTVASINGDAFSDEVKAEVVARLKRDERPIDLLVYSLAAPKRKDPRSDTVWTSVLKPIGQPYSGKSIDPRDDSVKEVTIPPASDQEIAATVRVMGGEDWLRWIDVLASAGLLATGFRTTAYSYIGPEVTHGIYRSGTIGRAKEHLEATARHLDALLAAERGGHAWVSVNKALVTQASAAIPVVPLYISLLFQVMKERGLHEGTIEQMNRLFADHLAPGREPTLDAEGRIRMDDREMDPAVQAAVAALWAEVNDDNLADLADIAGYRRDFQALFGFGRDDLDYAAATEVERPW